MAGDHRQVLDRQVVGPGDQDGVAGDLHRELRGADHGGADALARVPDRRQVLAAGQHVPQPFRQVGAEVAEAAALALVEIFGDAAGERDGVEGLVGELGRPGIGDQQALRQLVRRPPVDHAHDLAHHALDDAFAVLRRAAACPSARSMPRLLATSCAGSSMRVMPLVLVLDDQAAADRDRDGGEDLALLDQRELGGAAADVDIEHGVAVAARHRDGAGAVRRHLAFHVMAGGGADERSGHFREQFGDGARVVPLDRLAGQDHGAGVDVVGIDLREVVAAAEELGEVVGVDGVVGQVGRQHDRRLPHDLALDHDEAARQRGAEPLQMHQREHQVRGRGADVDADGPQLDIVGRPRDLVDLVIRNVVQVVEFEVVHRAPSSGQAGVLSCRPSRR